MRYGYGYGWGLSRDGGTSGVVLIDAFSAQVEGDRVFLSWEAVIVSGVSSEVEGDSVALTWSSVKA